MTALDTALRQAVHDYLTRRRISARRFGADALRDPSFVAALDAGRSVRIDTADRILAFIGGAPIAGAFRREVDAFLHVTRIKPSILGLETTGNPSFVTQLRRGFSPRLVTVTRVRAWMAAMASAEEASAINRAIGDFPAIACPTAPATDRPADRGAGA